MLRLIVELPACPECKHVWKLPYGAGIKGFCVGSAQNGTAHKKRRMVAVTFKGSVEPALKEAA